jgi:UDPglucose 6-dehydrogenase
VKIAVLGLWHLGTVVAACFAEHFDVVAWDPAPATVEGLRAGKPSIFEPELEDLVSAGIERDRLRFTGDLADCVRGSQIVCVAFDTPVDKDDRPDPTYVEKLVEETFDYLSDGAIVLITSQVPVGFTRRLAMSFAQRAGGRHVAFAYTPENLRLGAAIAAFRTPERIVIGIDDIPQRATLAEAFRPFCAELQWMRLESAEMAKHALNSFLAISVAFINEIARVSEKVGSDIKEIEAGLRSEPRVGQKAYISPGMGFSGGTLARDLQALCSIGKTNDIDVNLIMGAVESNIVQRAWVETKMLEIMSSLEGKRVAVLGLTYKPGTDTLRRSESVALCERLADRGAEVFAHDPSVRALPLELARITLCASPQQALSGADAMILATEWPEYDSLSGDELATCMAVPRIFDPKAALRSRLSDDRRFEYYTVGLGASRALS